VSATTETAPQRQSPFPYAVGICGGLFAFAFVAAPYSCDWGLNAYFVLGLVAMTALFTMPLVLWRRSSLSKRLLVGFGLSVIGFAAWIAGLFAANVQILCRLF